MNKLSSAENSALGVTSGVLDLFIVQPMVYWKNAVRRHTFSHFPIGACMAVKSCACGRLQTMRGEPFNMNPRVVYRGLTVAALSQGGICGVQVRQTSQRSFNLKLLML